MPDILKQFGQLWTHGRVLLEQELCEHCLVDRDHLLQIGSMKVHGMLAMNSDTFDWCLLRNPRFHFSFEA